MKRYVTNIETSKKLEAAGFTEFGRWVWITDLNEKKLVIETSVFRDLAIYRKGHDYDPHVAYMLEELLDMVRKEVSLRPTISRIPYIFHFIVIIRDWLLGKDVNLIQAVTEAIIWQKEQEKLK